MQKVRGHLHSDSTPSWPTDHVARKGREMRHRPPYSPVSVALATDSPDAAPSLASALAVHCRESHHLSVVGMLLHPIIIYSHLQPTRRGSARKFFFRAM